MLKGCLCGGFLVCLFFFYKAEMDGDCWHRLTLEEMILLTCSTGSRGNTGADNTVHTDRLFAANNTPPKRLAQDDLETYIVARWCPWFSRSFGPLSDCDMNTLAVKLLRSSKCRNSTTALEILTAVAIVLTRPNLTQRPHSCDRTLAKRLLFKD